MKTKKALTYRGARADSGMGEHKAQSIIQKQLQEARDMRWKKYGGMWEKKTHPWSKVWAEAESADAAMELAEHLPHGSGVDYAWMIEQTGARTFACSNAYHGMDEFGRYVTPVEFWAEVAREDGQWVLQDVTVVTPSLEEWGDPETYPACWYDLEDYLAETIDSAL